MQYEYDFVNCTDYIHLDDIKEYESKGYTLFQILPDCYYSWADTRILPSVYKDVYLLILRKQLE